MRKHLGPLPMQQYDTFYVLKSAALEARFDQLIALANQIEKDGTVPSDISLEAQRLLPEKLSTYSVESFSEGIKKSIIAIIIAAGVALAAYVTKLFIGGFFKSDDAVDTLKRFEYTCNGKAFNKLKDVYKKYQSGWIPNPSVHNDLHPMPHTLDEALIVFAKENQTNYLANAIAGRDEKLNVLLSDKAVFRDRLRELIELEHSVKERGTKLIKEATDFMEDVERHITNVSNIDSEVDALVKTYDGLITTLDNSQGKYTSKLGVHPLGGVVSLYKDAMLSEENNTSEQRSLNEIHDGLFKFIDFKKAEAILKDVDGISVQVKKLNGSISRFNTKIESMEGKEGNLPRELLMSIKKTSSWLYTEISMVAMYYSLLTKSITKVYAELSKVNRLTLEVIPAIESMLKERGFTIPVSFGEIQKELREYK